MSKPPSVLAVVINWKRPANIPLVIAALRAQSIPVHISIVECAPINSEFSLPLEVITSADTVFSVAGRNLGPRSRFIPGSVMPEFEYIFFAVDDYLPGERCVSYFVYTAERVGRTFATLGQEGRLVRGDQLSRRRIRMDADALTPVDVVTSSELIRRQDADCPQQFAVSMLEDHGDKVSLFEDDLLLCFGIQKITGFPSKLTPTPRSPAESWRAHRLPAPHALSARPDHRERRDLFVKQAMACGWRSCV